MKTRYIKFEDIDMKKVVSVRKTFYDALWHIMYADKFENFGNYERYEHYDRVVEDVALKVAKKL